jgi:hypothetical protein
MQLTQFADFPEPIVNPRAVRSRAKRTQFFLGAGVEALRRDEIEHGVELKDLTRVLERIGS